MRSILFLVLFFVAIPLAVRSQQALVRDSTLIDSLQQVTADSLPPPVQSDSISDLLVRKLEEFTSGMNKASGVLKRGLDTFDIHDELPRLKRLLDNIKINLYESEVPANLRSLNAFKVLLMQTGASLDSWQKDLEKYSGNLRTLRQELLDIADDSAFRKLDTDTMLRNLYLDQLTDLDKKLQTVRTGYTAQSAALSRMLHLVGGASIDATDLLAEVDYRIKVLKRRMLLKTEPYIWERLQREKGGLVHSLLASARPNWVLVKYYMKDHWQPLAWMALISFLFAAWVWNNLRKIAGTSSAGNLSPAKYLQRHHVSATFLLLFTITPFFSYNPPAAYIELCWVFMLLVATRLAWPDWSVKYHRYWKLIVALFILFGYDNLLTGISPGERWFTLLLMGLSVYVGWQMVKEVKREPSRYPVFQDKVLFLFAGANLFALLFNIFGRFTLSKVISNAAVIGLAHGLSFYLLVEIIIEAFYLQAEVNKSTRFTAYLQFPKVKEKFRRMLVFLGMFFWLLAFLWSLNLLDSARELISGFLGKARFVGSMEFTLGSIFVFLLVLYISVVVSNLLSIFFGGTESQVSSAQKNKFGSWVLLIRLFVISIGFLLAIGAAGIPLDKIAIVLGALGVGIGFGLQNIVNNLVSGIILAFEKPMDVGDVIEIGTNSGRVKEVGIRSSKISTFDGADIIVPNGDFISQRLVNWTHRNNYRRIDLTIGVAYGTDLDFAQKTIQQVLDENEHIAAQPAPSILWNDMGNNAMVVKVYFWTSDFDSWLLLKSNVIKTIYSRFLEKGISIPFPQQDLHIRSVDEELLRKFRDNTEDGNTK